MVVARESAGIVEVLYTYTCYVKSPPRASQRSAARVLITIEASARFVTVIAGEWICR